jgi:HD-GYP domain-containing protein (c-di-GMP phosphodiesterase class II)
MSTTLLVENNQELESFYSLNLQTWVGTSIIPKKEAKFCSKIFEDDTEIDLIITKARNGLEKSAEAIFQMMQKSGKKIPIIVIGKSTLTDESIIHLPSGLDIKPLMQTAGKLLDVTAQDMAKLQVPDFFEIPINYFLSLKRSVTDVYEENIDNQGTYLKKLNEFQEFDQDLIKTYIQEGVGSLYVKKQDRLYFVTNVTQELVSKIEMTELNDDEQVSAAEMGQKLLNAKLTRIGITEETTNLANKQLKMMSSTAKKYPKMGKLLGRLMRNKTGYLFKHSQILTYICSHLMDHIDWGNEEQKKKISFIALFHDILLENDEQAQIHTEKELKESDFDPATKELINSHAQKAAELIVKYPGAPMGADAIIRQHHGVTHGIGFAQTYGGNLSPMVIVFILAEELTSEIISSGKELKMERVLSSMREKYPTQRFQKIIDVMETITL